MTRLYLTKLFVVAFACSVGCGNDGRSTHQDAGVDAMPSCFTNPSTHEEIINACTTAQKIYKDSRPALLHPDGTLPPLP